MSTHSMVRLIYMVNDNDVIESIDDLSAVEAKEKARSAAKPLIDHLEDAVDKDQFGNLVLNAKVGDKIVIERFATVLSHRPWLDTKTYVITNVDGVTGDLGLMDTDLGQSAMSNYITGTKAGYRFKLPNAKGVSIGKRKRGRPRKNPTGAPEPTKPVQLDPNGQPVKKKRGRPAGTKNRPKDIIRAEKKAKLEKRKAKATKRKSITKSKAMKRKAK